MAVKKLELSSSFARESKKRSLEYSALILTKEDNLDISDAHMSGVDIQLMTERLNSVLKNTLEVNRVFSRGNSYDKLTKLSELIACLESYLSIFSASDKTSSTSRLVENLDVIYSGDPPSKIAMIFKRFDFWVEFSTESNEDEIISELAKDLPSTLANIMSFCSILPLTIMDLLHKQSKNVV